jgi:predicted  nucleic acid-binding Zn-ribbon protein
MNMATAKFDIKTEATRPFYAAAGAAEQGVEVAKKYVADLQDLVTDVQKKVTAFEFEPKALNDKAVAGFNTRREALTKDAKDAQAKFEAQVKDVRPKFEALLKDLQAELKDAPAKLQAEAKAAPTKLEAKVKELQAELKDAQAKLEAKVAELQADAKALPAKLQAEVKDLVAELTKAYEDFAKRGEAVIAKLRKTEVVVETPAPAKKAPAKKAPAKKTAAKKATATKA